MARKLPSSTVIKLPPVNNYQDLLNRFDGPNDGDKRLAWYGQERAMSKDHFEAVMSTYLQFQTWCNEYWPLRGIELPDWWNKGLDNEAQRVPGISLRQYLANLEANAYTRQHTDTTTWAVDQL